MFHLNVKYATSSWAGTVRSPASRSTARWSCVTAFTLSSASYAPATINLRLAAVRRIAYEAADAGLLSPELAAGIRRVKGVRRIGVRLGNWLTPEQGRRLLAQAAVRDATHTTRPCHARDADRMRAAARRAPRADARIDSATRRSLGDRRLGWQGPACADGADSDLGEDTPSMNGRSRRGSRTALCSARSTRPGASGATGCLPRCSGMSSGQRPPTPTSTSWRRTIFGARALDSVIWPAANWIRSSSSSGTSRFRFIEDQHGVPAIGVHDRERRVVDAIEVRCRDQSPTAREGREQVRRRQLELSSVLAEEWLILRPRR